VPRCIGGGAAFVPPRCFYTVAGRRPAHRVHATPTPDVRFADLAVGQQASFTKTVTEADIVLFAGITGDLNPLHVDQVWAARSRFGGRIAHGMLTAGFVSTVIGMYLPGRGAIYLRQSLSFTRPVRIGDTITARGEVLELIGDRHQVRLRTTVENQRAEIVLEGEALVMVADDQD
jgi:3-hydroxybutyryl-CoA dehydratase